MQGEAPLTRLLEKKREQPSTVLLGTDSLWEGIDVPGEALTLLVITRLPFQNPSHPLTQARLIYDADRQELVSEAARLAFPIREGIPIMLVDEARKLSD